MLARLVFCFENNPERHDGIISGAQDSIGICVPGLVRHYYDNNFWPEKIESTQDEMTLRFLEDHLVMIRWNREDRDAVWWKVRISRLRR